jgi:hypothetical protein
MTASVQNNTPQGFQYETTVWLGLAVGVAVGIGIAIARRKQSRWSTARRIANRVSEHSTDFAEATGELAGRVRNLFEEGRRVVADASHLWANGRKLVGY